MNYEVEERVDRLETVLSQFILQTNTVLTRFERGLENFQKGINDFKDEMRDFKDEMRDLMRESKKSQEEQTLQMNKHWGDLANKWGTLVEDLVFPSFPSVIYKKFNEEIVDKMTRRVRKLPDGRIKEFDLIAISRQHVFLNSTKSQLTSHYVDEFVEDIGLFWNFFPQHRDKKLIGVMASPYIDESVLIYAERNGFLVLGIGMEIMEIKNRPDFQPKTWVYQDS
jgi:hypothetical protein